MYKITFKKQLNVQSVQMEILAPLVAKKAQPGQFIILRVNENGERIPLTIAGYDREKGTVQVIFQIVGKTTTLLSQMKEGEYISDFAGPLGHPSEIEGVKKAIVVGGGLGTAIAYPYAKALHDNGAEVDMIAGFKTKDLVILENEMKNACTRLHIMTDDGSYGGSGMVTVRLKELLEADKDAQTYDLVVAIGPLVMMKFCALTTKEYGVKTVVSMNPIMIDGTGMCGGCRLSVGGETRFACVDGPEFDAHQVDFDEAIRRSSYYKEKEVQAHEEHQCRLGEVR